MLTHKKIFERLRCGSAGTSLCGACGRAWVPTGRAATCKRRRTSSTARAEAAVHRHLIGDCLLSWVVVASMSAVSWKGQVKSVSCCYLSDSRLHHVVVQASSCFHVRVRATWYLRL